MIQTEVNDRFVDAAQMFGGESCAVGQPVAESAGAWASTGGSDPLLQSLCIVLLFCIVLMLRYGSQLRTLLGGMVRGFAEEFESSRKVAGLAGGFFNTAIAAGIVAVAVTVVKYALLWSAADGYGIEGVWQMPVVALGVVAAVAAIIIYERFMLLAIGFVAGCRDFMDTLLFVKRACFSVAAVVMSPVVLLTALSTGSEQSWMWVIAGQCVVLSFLFLKESFVLFIRKKVPIFQWFLYLCTVEVFPITLICASIARFR